jgi:hypothetical protein
MADEVWGINSAQKIYYWNGTGWTNIPGALARIAVNGGQVWGINSAQKIYYWNGTGWTNIPGALVSIAVGSDGQVWGINSAQKIYYWNGTGWTNVPGALVTIAVNGGQVWGINEAQEIYKWNGTDWTNIAGALVSIAIGSDGQVWGINSAQLIYNWNGTGWTQIAGALVTIAVGPGPQVGSTFVITANWLNVQDGPPVLGIAVPGLNFVNAATQQPVNTIPGPTPGTYLALGVANGEDLGPGPGFGDNFLVDWTPGSTTWMKTYIIPVTLSASGSGSAQIYVSTPPPL